jgi:type I restriction enzyme S subunit
VQKSIILPKRWVWTTIEEVLLTLESGGRPKGGVKNIKDGIPSIGGEHLLYNGGFDFTNIRYIPNDFYKKMAKGRILKHDVLVVKDGATTGKTSFVSDTFPYNEAAVNEHVFILRLPEEQANPKYLSYWMQSSYGQKCVKDNFQGTAQGGINTTFVSNSDFPFPPFTEQNRIVTKIEELFTKLDAGIDALKKIKAELKRYRQSVLKSAFEGKLTEEWRKKNKDKLEPASVLLNKIKEERKKKLGNKYKELLPNDTDDLLKLPEGWGWAMITNLITSDGVFIDGDWVESKDQDPQGEVRLIQLADVGDGEYRNKSNRHLTYKKAIELQCTFLKPGDLLVARMPEPLGRACIFPGDKKSCVTVVDVCIVRIGSIGPINRWLMYAINSSYFRSEVASFQSGSTRKRISRSNLAKLQLPISSVDEQLKISEEIERRFSVADAIEKTVEQSLKQAERLRQSILKRAFEGKLVPQDPTDEPAEKLLVRIKVEKEKRVSERNNIKVRLPRPKNRLAMTKRVRSKNAQ